MYAIVNQAGQLRYQTVDDPQPGEGEVRIAVTAAGVNRADIMQRRGNYPPPPGASDILGLEASGVVDAVGAGVSSWQLGDPVVALLAGGGYAEKVVVPAGQCVASPQGMTLIEAGGLMEVCATVLSNFDHVNVQAGETILIHGGAGGIGSFAIPYAKSLGMTVVATAGSSAKTEYAQSLGADKAIDYHSDWPGAVLDFTGGVGVDVILDVVGAKYLPDNISVLAFGGRLCVLGLQGGANATIDLAAMQTKVASLTATTLRFRPLAQKAAIVAAVAARVWPLFETGQLDVPRIASFPLSQADAAHAALDSGANIGKIVLTV